MFRQKLHQEQEKIWESQIGGTNRADNI